MQKVDLNTITLDLRQTCAHVCMFFIPLNWVYRLFCSQVDVPAVFADKVMKAAMKHIEIIAKAHEKGLHVNSS